MMLWSHSSLYQFLLMRPKSDLITSFPTFMQYPQLQFSWQFTSHKQMIIYILLEQPHWTHVLTIMFPRVSLYLGLKSVTMGGLFDLKLLKFRMFLIYLHVNSSSYSFRTIAIQKNVKYSECFRYFKQNSDSRCKQSVCSHYGLYPPPFKESYGRAFMKMYKYIFPSISSKQWKLTEPWKLSTWNQIIWLATSLR